MRGALAALILLAAGCASAPPNAADEGDGTLAADLFPFRAETANFVFQRGGATRPVRIEPDADGTSARLVLDVSGEAPREMRVTRSGASLFFSSGPGRGTELLRGGAKPGDAWESDERRVSFDGWERVAGFDAARVTARHGPPTLEQTETWWFARGVGLVRMRSDHGGLFSDEMVRQR